MIQNTFVIRQLQTDVTKNNALVMTNVKVVTVICIIDYAKFSTINNVINQLVDAWRLLLQFHLNKRSSWIDVWTYSVLVIFNVNRKTVIHIFLLIKGVFVKIPLKVVIQLYCKFVQRGKMKSFTIQETNAMGHNAYGTGNVKAVIVKEQRCCNSIKKYILDSVNPLKICPFLQEHAIKQTIS